VLLLQFLFHIVELCHDFAFKFLCFELYVLPSELLLLQKAQLFRFLELADLEGYLALGLGVKLLPD